MVCDMDGRSICTGMPGIASIIRGENVHSRRANNIGRIEGTRRPHRDGNHRRIRSGEETVANFCHGRMQ